MHFINSPPSRTGLQPALSPRAPRPASTGRRKSHTDSNPAHRHSRPLRRALSRAGKSSNVRPYYCEAIVLTQSTAGRGTKAPPADNFPWAAELIRSKVVLPPGKTPGPGEGERRKFRNPSVSSRTPPEQPPVLRRTFRPVRQTGGDTGTLPSSWITATSGSAWIGQLPIDRNRSSAPLQYLNRVQISVPP